MKYDSNGTKKECTVWVHPSETVMFYYLLNFESINIELPFT